MKFMIVVALALVASAAAAPQQARAPAEPIQILRSLFEQQPDGPYKTEFETQNGIVQQETGELKTVNDEDNKPRNVIVVRGSYSYTDNEGKPVSVQYYADETGFHAEGDSIPKPVSRR